MQIFVMFFDILSKYTWVIPLKDKKGVTVTKAFQNLLKAFNCKQTKYGQIKGGNFTIDQ